MARFGRVVALFLALSGPVYAITVELHAAEISNRVLRLGDVAAFGGVTHAEADRLAEQTIGFAPAPGTARQVPLETIKLAVVRMGYLPGDVKIVGQAPTITRRAARVGTDRIAADVLAELKKRVPADVTLSVQRVTEPAPLPEGRIEIAVQAPQKLERTFVVPVIITSGEESVRTNAVVKAERLGTVYQASRRLERGALIDESAISERTCDLFDAPTGTVFAREEIVGTIASRTITPGTVMTSSAIEKLKLVKRGDAVTIRVNIPGVEVSMAGTAMEPGAFGETIRVKNQTSGKLISGRVTGAGEVMIVE